MKYIFGFYIFNYLLILKKSLNLCYIDCNVGFIFDWVVSFYGVKIRNGYGFYLMFFVYIYGKNKNIVIRKIKLFFFIF